MKKKLIIFFPIIILLILGLFLFKDKISNTNTQISVEQKIFQSTLNISKDYSRLRFLTENVLENAEDFADYDEWNRELNEINEGWIALESKAQELETAADKIADTAIGFDLVKNIQAYDSVEIQKVIESAPAGKQIRTLAKHLGVDAKMAQLILNQTQDQIIREAYGEEGDVFEQCEQNSMRIKNGAKVTVFVGGVVLTGGASAVAASGVVAKTALVVSGADLVLEITDDEARIALGDKNKVSKMVGELRTVTEPAASILTIVNMPGNVSKAMEKIGAISFAGDQLRLVIQDEKILGISIKVDDQGELKAEASGLTEAELTDWKKDNNVQESTQSVQEIMKEIEEEINEIKTTEEVKPTNVTQEDSKTKTSETNSHDMDIQIIKIRNVSGVSYMMDSCYTPKCWDDLAANPAEDRDVGGIYTLGKIFANGEGFEKGFRPADLKASGRLEETSANSYKVMVYFALTPFEGPKNKTIDYGTWESASVEINANYGDEPVIEWDGSSFKQVK